MADPEPIFFVILQNFRIYGKLVLNTTNIARDKKSGMTINRTNIFFRSDGNLRTRLYTHSVRKKINIFIVRYQVRYPLSVRFNFS